jgi:translation initiation factor 2 subunit 1
VDETGGYVRLVEYNDMEAMILATNTTRKRIKNVKKLLRLGTQDFMQVLSTEVKEDKVYVDLSKRTI